MWTAEFSKAWYQIASVPAGTAWLTYKTSMADSCPSPLAPAPHYRQAANTRQLDKAQVPRSPLQTNQDQWIFLDRTENSGEPLSSCHLNSLFPACHSHNTGLYHTLENTLSNVTDPIGVLDVDYYAYFNFPTPSWYISILDTSRTIEEVQAEKETLRQRR